MKDIRKKIIFILKNNSGAAYIEAAFIILAIMMIIAIMTAFLPIFAHINRIHTYATNAARIISVEGGLTPDAMYKIEEYKTKMKLDMVNLYYTNSTFLSDGVSIQLNDEIVVEADTYYVLSVLKIPVNIPIHTKALSRSEVYHKL